MALLCQGAISGEAADPVPPKSVEIVRTSEVITIDGSLSEPVWQRPGITQFTQQDPDQGKPATERTEVWLAYDDQAIYVAARLSDESPDSIVVRLVRRDGQINSDDFAVYFDPYHDHRSGFFFGLNAGGTQYDGTLYNDEWNDNSWDGVWEGKVKTDARGWSLEMRIPFSQLRFQHKEKEIWGVNFIREIARKNEKDYLVYTPRNGSGFVSRFPDLVGMDNIDPPRRIEVLPYLSTKAEYVQHAAGDPFNNGSRYTPGIGGDVKFGIGSNLTLDASVNPDFGQVEVDPAVVNLSDVETFFQEKRPFFIEGSSIFDFGYGGANNNWGFNWGTPSFFYSRRIGRNPQGAIPDNASYSDVPTGTHIAGAAKLSGKLGDNWSIGAINAVTSREFARVDTSGRKFDWEVEPLSYYGVFRGQKEFNNGRQGLGLLSTVAVRSLDQGYLQDELNKSSLALGLDGWTMLDSSQVWVINGWVGGSYVHGTTARMIALQTSSAHYLQRPDARHVSVDSSATQLEGVAGRIALNKQKGDFYLNSALGFVGPTFDVDDVGYMWRTDIINGHLVLGYRWNNPGTVTRKANVNVSTFRSYDFGKNLVWSGYWTNGYVQFLTYHSVDWFFAYNPESYSDRRTRGGPLTISPRGYEFGGDINTDDRQTWILGLSADILNYSLGVDHGRYLSGSVQYKPASNLSLTVSPAVTSYRTSAQWVTNVEDPTAAATFGNRYIFAQLNQHEVSAGIRVDWTFTPRLSLQMYVQPLISVGEYSGIKELASPKTLDFTTYGTGNSTVTRNGTDYVIDPDGNGPAVPFTVSDPDFNFKSLRGSAVLRWEYMPGSAIYLVWTQQRVDDSDPGQFRIGRDFSTLFQSMPDNVFMIKLTYWANP